MGVVRPIGDEVRELYSMGESIENIMDRLNLPKSEVSYFCGEFINSREKPYIKNDEKRNTEIDKLKIKRNKSYKEIIYLSYLQWRISKSLYSSAFTLNKI